MQAKRFVWVVAIQMSAVSCGGGGSGSQGDGDLPNIECPDPVPTFSELTAFPKCVTCHDSKKLGAARKKALLGWDFDTYDGAQMRAEKIAEWVFKGYMPPDDSGITLTEQEEQDLYAWALCGTPE